MEYLKPQTEAQAQEVVQWALANDTPLEIVGAGSKRALGHPVEATHGLDMSGVSGVFSYEPQELVLTAGPGTPMDELDNVLAKNDQMLAFEPVDAGYALAGARAPGSLGGAVMTGLAGPRRAFAGGVRDHVLGMRAISGRGEIFQSGGKVVKNVTGYDLPKLITGSYGTLAVATEITLKVLPRPEKAYTLLILGLEPEQGMAVMRGAAGSAFNISGAAYVPAVASAVSSVGYIAGAGASVTAIRVEGAGISVTHRVQALRDLLGADLSYEELHSHNSRVFWSEVGAVTLLPGTGQLWRLSVPPAAAAEVVARVEPDHWIADWAGGLLWLQFEDAERLCGARIRSAIRQRGHATLFRASEALRARSEVFEPQDTVLANLTRRVRENFDPANILNRGRMGADAD